MAKLWHARCNQCGAPFSYSDHLALRDASLGHARQILCKQCEKLDGRGLKATAAAAVLLQSDGEQIESILGRVELPEPRHMLEVRPSELERDKFGIRDEEIQALYAELSREDTPVVIAVAPTGSGKSTFLPYRLLVPDGLPDDAFTAGRQIVITQPRRGATIGIAGHVAGSLHGADVGINHEIGYRVSGEHACDWRNRMVYVTDGTLVNWIIQGELDRISLVIIDEAHERSLNIDVILGLLTHALPRYPHLKMLIVSATIDHEKFRSFFDKRLPGGMRCGVVECSGSKPVGLHIHWLNPANGVLPFNRGPLPDLGKLVWKHLADAIVRLVVEMYSPSGIFSSPLQEGDVLGFLHGAKPIQDACDYIRNRLKKEYPQLEKTVDIYPYYAAADENIRRKATEKKQDPSRTRIVIASNAAETSITIEGLVHVIDSGFIKQTEWNPILEQAPLLPVAHSQAGCRQRWGRVGRTAEGFAWSIYTKEQFEQIFPRDTKPDIQRSCLDDVILKAKRGGADRVVGDVFPWLDAPDIQEIKRSEERLLRQGSIDKHGDLTRLGVEIALSGGEDALFSRVIADADRFGFGIEIATLLPFLKQGLSDLFPDDRDWSTEDRRAVRAAQDNRRAACVDDLELCFRVYQDWVELTQLPPKVAWTVPLLPNEYHHTVRGGSQKVDALNRKLQQARAIEGVRQIIMRDMIMPPQHWCKDVERALEGSIRSDFARRFGIDTGVLRTVVSERKDLIRQLGAKKKELEDRPIDFAGLDRLRILIAQAFPEHIYRKLAATGAGGEEARYERVNPDNEFSPLLGIGSSSCCRAQPPEMVLAIGPKQQTKSGSGTDERDVLLAPFVIQIDPVLYKSIANLPDSDIAFSDWFREKLPRIVRGSEEERRQQVHEILRRDYPSGTLVECRIQSISDGDTEVKVVRAVGWAGIHLKQAITSDTRREKLADTDEQNFDPRFSKKSNVRVQSLKDEFSDVIDELIEADNERNTASSVNMTDKSGGGHGAVPGFEIQGRLRWFGRQNSLHRGDVVLAEVTHHTDRRAQPSLIVATPPSRDRFNHFLQLYKPGDEAWFEVIAATPPGSLQRGLQMREVVTGLDVTVPIEKLAIFSEQALLRVFPVGAIFPLWIESIDKQYQNVNLMGTSKLEPYLQQFQAQNEDEFYAATVLSIDFDNRRFYVIVILDNSRPEDGLIIPAKILQDRFDSDQKPRFPYRPGDKVHVKVRVRNDGKSQSLGIKLSRRETEALEMAQVSFTRSQLSCQQRISFETYNSLLEKSETAEFAAAVQKLYLSSNEIFGEHIFTDLEQRFPVGKTVKGTVTRVQRTGISLKLKDNVAGYVAREEVSWWVTENSRVDTFVKPGDVVTGKVLRVSTSEQLVYLSLRMAQADSKQKAVEKFYPLSKEVDGIVSDLRDFGAFVELEPGLDGMIHVSNLRAFNKGQFVDKAGDILKENERVRVRVSEIITGEKIALELIARLGMAHPDPKVEEEEKILDVESNQSVEEIDWNGTIWPWTEGENAIIEREQLKPLAPPKSPKREPLEKRPNPLSWTLNW